MRVIDAKHVEDCFDGSLIKELLLSEAITKAFIFALGKEGHVQYFPHFARPFFKIRVHRLYDVKGIEGNNTMRVHFKDPQRYALEAFMRDIASLCDGAPSESASAES